MNLGDSNQRFGIYWLAFGYTLALHVLDEAGNNFLAVYNPNAAAIRRTLPFLPVPIFSYQDWIGRLLLGLTLWLALTPLAFRGVRWLKWLAIPISLLAGIANGALHIVSSIYYARFMPGVFSALLIIASGVLVLRSAVKRGGETRQVSASA